MQDLSKYIDGELLFDGHYRLIKLLSAEGGTADVWLAENYESVDTKLSEDTDDVIRVDGTGVLVRTLGLSSRPFLIVIIQTCCQPPIIQFVRVCPIWLCRFARMVPPNLLSANCITRMIFGNSWRMFPQD